VSHAAADTSSAMLWITNRSAPVLTAVCWEFALASLTTVLCTWSWCCSEWGAPALVQKCQLQNSAILAVSQARGHRDHREQQKNTLQLY
jgi:hypothetical protein